MRATTLFGKNDYTPWLDEDLEGKIVVLKVDHYDEEFQDAKYQLALATGGFGCRPNARGNAIFVTECHNDNPDSFRIERCDRPILGIATEEAIKEWKRKYGEFNEKVLSHLNKLEVVKLRKVKVSIEETLCKTVEIEVPDNVDDILAWAMDKAIEMYKNEEIVLTSDDFNGARNIMAEDEDGNQTEWDDF